MVRGSNLVKCLFYRQFLQQAGTDQPFSCASFLWVIEHLASTWEERKHDAFMPSLVNVSRQIFLSLMQHSACAVAVSCDDKERLMRVIRSSLQCANPGTIIFGLKLVGIVFSADGGAMVDSWSCCVTLCALLSGCLASSDHLVRRKLLH